MSDGWTMKGLRWNDPYRIRSAQELVNWILEIGFLPFFANGIDGFSAEEHVSPDFWWTGDPEQDPWAWREVIAGGRQVAYGKFFDGRAGFISPEWLPYFANCRRDGYDFDAKWQSGAANRREKQVMEHFMDVASDDEPTFTGAELLSTELKRMAGFGKGGEKNFPGIVTGLQMQLYLVIAGFRRRRNRRGEAYGMPVSVLAAPESLWGYDRLTAAYGEAPSASWERIAGRVRQLWPSADGDDVLRLIGRSPAD